MTIICPNCFKVLHSQHGLTLHMNAMHLKLSSSQVEQAKKWKPKR